MAESHRILILEDNPADAELVQFELQEAGLLFTATQVTSQEDYLQNLQEFPPDLILSDYDLPHYNGALALAEAKINCPDTPFILVSGAVSEDRAIEILTQGAKDYVLKTRLQQRLVPAVRRALAEAAEQKARKKAEIELRKMHVSLERQVAERTAALQRQIEHSRNVEETLLQYNERLEILSYTAGQLLVSDKPQQLVEELCRKVMTFLDCQVFFNFLVDEFAGRLHLNACAGIPPQTAREIEWLDIDMAVCGCVARDGLRIIAENIPETPDIRTDLIKSFGIKAYACHPLLHQQRVIGTLSFGTRTRTAFSMDDLAMMKAVTDQVAIAMSRVRMEDTMRQITERFEMAQHAAQVGTWDWNIVTGHIEWSPEMFHVFRLDPQKNRASFEQWKSIIHPEDVRSAGLRIDEALQKKGILNSDYRIITPDGQIRWINAVGEGKYNDQNQAVRMIGICIDITVRKQTEEALRESEERYRELVYSSPEAVIVHSDGQFLYANPAALRLYGVQSLDQLRQHTVLDLIPEDEHSGITLRMKQGKAGERLSLEETKLTRLDGQVVEVESVGGVISYNGKPAVQVMIRDITERKRTEDAILHAKLEWERTFDTLPDMIAILDDQHRIVRINKAMAKRLNVLPQNCVGMSCHEVIHGLPSPPAFCPHSLTCRDGRQHMAEFHEPCLGGDFLVSTTPLLDSAGKPVGSVHVARDITERKLVENRLAKQAVELQERTTQLEELNRELESFSYSVSHDLRAPLRAIDGFSRILEREYADKIDEKGVDTINVIRSNAKLMGVLIDNLLSFSRVQNTGMNIAIIDMCKLVKEAIKEIGEANKERKLNFKIAKILPGYGDLNLIRQVLFNLFENAVKFTKNKRQSVIEMNSYMEDDKVVYCIKDNGAGFDMEYYNKLFGVFQRLHSYEEYEGTGVGLAIVQRIIQRHGGRVWAEGKVGKGAAFYFTLPQKL